MSGKKLPFCIAIGGKKADEATGSGWVFWRLTFDMRGGRQQAKPDVGRPLDGRVRPQAGARTANAFNHVATLEFRPCRLTQERDSLPAAS